MDREQLATVPLFSRLDKARLAWLADRCPPRDVTASAVVQTADGILEVARQHGDRLRPRQPRKDPARLSAVLLP